jgi:hypothetical protein
MGGVVAFTVSKMEKNPSSYERSVPEGADVEDVSSELTESIVEKRAGPGI